MRSLASLALIAGLLSSSCTPIVREVRHPGGYPGYVLDRRMFDASRSKDVQLLRAAIILAMASRMATATVRDGKDADAFADYLAAASDELNYAAANIYPVGDKSPCALREDASSNAACGGYYALFESDMPMVESRIIKLMLAALPEGRGRQFLADISKGNALGAAWSAIRGVYESTGGLHRSSGVYRSGLELVASSVNCVNGEFDPSKGTMWAAADCLGLSHEKFNDSPNELRGEGMNVRVKRDAFYALMLVARTSCARLPVATDKTIEGEVSKRKTACESVKFEPKYRPTQIN